MNLVFLGLRLAVSLLAATSLLAPTVSASAAPDISGVTLRVGDQAGQFHSKLDAAHLLGDVPYRIDWAVFPAAVNIHEALKAGALDIGFAGASPTLIAIAGGSPIKIVGGWDAGGRGVYLLVPENSPIRTAADLRGKTISPSGRGSAGHYVVVQALRSAGLTVNDVKLAFLQPTDANAAFNTGTIDAWGTWGTYGLRAIGSHKARVLIDTTSLHPELYVASAADAALADPAIRAAIGDLLKRIDAGYAWARSDRTDYIRWFAGFAKQDPVIAAEAREIDAGYRRVPVDDAFLASLRETVRTWIDGGVLKSDIDVGPAVDRGFALE